MRRLLAAAALLAPLAAHAGAPAERGEQLGQVVSGVVAVLMPDGKVDFQTSGPVYLDTGRRLDLQKDGSWRISPASAVPMQTVKAIDVALYASRYQGRPIRIVGGRFYGVSVDWGLLGVPGDAIRVDFAGMDREQLRYLLTHCDGLGDMPGCRLTVVGTLSADNDGKFELRNPAIEMPSKRLPISRAVSR